MTKKEIQDQINELQLELDKCEEVKPFTCKGEWTIDDSGYSSQGSGNIIIKIKYFNYWQTKEIAEKAYQLQLAHRKMLSFVSQHQEVGKGSWYVFNYANEWRTISTVAYQPGSVLMTKETADLMLEAIENGSLDLEEKQ